MAWTTVNDVPITRDSDKKEFIGKEGTNVAWDYSEIIIDHYKFDTIIVAVN